MEGGVHCMSHCVAYRVCIGARQKSLSPRFAAVCNAHVFPLFKGIMWELGVHLAGVRVILACSLRSMCILQIDIVFSSFDTEPIPVYRRFVMFL